MKIGVVIPSLNEADALKKLLQSIEAQLTMELDLIVTVVDGLSQDNSTQVVAEFSTRSEKFHLLINEKKITPVALNIGTKFCLERGADVVQYFGAHSVIHIDYFINLISLLNKHEEFSVFSPSMDFTAPQSNFELINQHFTISRFGRNWNKIYRMSEPLYGFTTGLMAVRRSVFEKIGFYNEEMVRNQDNEFAHRIEQSDLAICTHPQLIYYYQVRSNLSKLLWQMYHSAVFVGFNLRTHNIKHKIPFLFWMVNLLLVIGLCIAKWVQPQLTNLLIFSLTSVNFSYLVFLLLEYFRLKIRRSNPSVKLLLLVILIHIIYAFGTVVGLKRSFFKKKII